MNSAIFDLVGKFVRGAILLQVRFKNQPVVEIEIFESRIMPPGSTLGRVLACRDYEDELLNRFSRVNPIFEHSPDLWLKR